MQELPDHLLIYIFDYLFNFDEYYSVLYDLNYFRLDLVSPQFNVLLNYKYSLKKNTTEILPSLNILLDISNGKYYLTREPKKKKYYKKLNNDILKMVAYF